MTRTYLLSALLFFTGTAMAQNGKKNTELGVNVTNIITGLFDADELLGAEDPFLLSIKTGHDNKYFRMAFNLAAGHKEEDLNDGGTTFTRTTDDFAFFSRFGFERRKTLGKRSTLYWGGDGLFTWSQVKTETDNTSFEDFFIKNQLYGLGVGPVLGFQFAVHPRILITTETAMYFFVEWDKVSQSFGSFPGVDQTSTSYNFSPRLPGAIYVHFVL